MPLCYVVFIIFTCPVFAPEFSVAVGNKISAFSYENIRQVMFWVSVILQGIQNYIAHNLNANDILHT